MPEAEVSLRLAFWLIKKRLVRQKIDVAIDGAQVYTNKTVHFNLPAFLKDAGWTTEQPAKWQGVYRTPDTPVIINVHSRPGQGDLVANLISGKNLRVECKKGPLSRKSSSPEYRLIREALGQLLTMKEVGEKDILAVAVPHSQKFAELASRWREAPLLKQFRIRILTVDGTGNVEGFALT